MAVSLQVTEELRGQRHAPARMHVCVCVAVRSVLQWAPRHAEVASRARTAIRAAPPRPCPHRPLLSCRDSSPFVYSTTPSYQTLCSSYHTP